MEAKTLHAFLRVLYTVNNNPQYILAKSSSQVPVVVCNETTAQPATSELAYARAPLKACLAVVCDSSPELLQDSTRDFSLYFLDPLEAQPPPTGLAQAAHNTTSPRGVAVALGLMSWALESSDSANVFVTGTIVPNASLALEVICTLRETKRMPKPVFHSYPPPGSMPTFIPTHPPPVGMCWSFNSHPQLDQQKTLTRSADFPEVYIGPPRRARGRPGGSTSSKSKVKAPTRSSSLGSSTVADTQSEPKQTVSKQKTKSRPSRPPPTYSPFICAPLTRNSGTAGQEGDPTEISILNQSPHLEREGVTSHSQNQPHAGPDLQPQSQPHPTHILLAGLLSALSSASGTSTGDTTVEQQAALISALQGLLGTKPHLAQPPVTEGLPPNIGEKVVQDLHGNRNPGDEHDDGDSDIVVLDSSTIDTTIFRKASARQLATNSHDASSFTENHESPMLCNEGTDSSPLPASTPPSVQESTSVSSQTSTPSNATESTSTITTNSETPKRNCSGRVGRDNNLPDMPTTPTPSRTRKRKLDEYSQDQSHWSTPLSPPSPSPSVTRTSSSRRAVNAANQAQSSPSHGALLTSSPSTQLPSMLGSIRGVATSNSRSRVPSGYSMHQGVTLLTTEKKGNQSTTHLPKSRADHGIMPDASSLKRRRTLTEFMAEQESRKSLKARKQSSSVCKSGTETPANVPPLRSGHLGSPLKLLFRSDSMVSALQPPVVSTSQFGACSAVISNPVSSFTTTLTSTGSSTTTSTTQTKNPFKNFVVPAWARTSTATLPRLSEEALARQKTEQEAKKAQVSLRRREAARAKRKQHHRAASPSKDSSDEDEIVAGDTKRRMLPPLSSSPTRSVPVSQPPPTLPVFASDAVAPIASSPPPSHRQPVPLTVPTTPPKKPIPLSGSGPHHTPSKSGSCSLFTPSGQDSMTLFTPSTPSLTRSQTRSRFTPRSPTAPRQVGSTKSSPWKRALQTPRTPRRNDSDHRTPRSLRCDRQPLFASPGMANSMPQTQTGTSTRAFLLPPPSPCAPRASHRLRQVLGTTPIAPHDSGTRTQASLQNTHIQSQREGKDNDTLSHERNEALVEHVVTPPAECSPSQGNKEPNGINTDGDMDPVEEEYASSPLPPSSPLPASPFSSPGPTKYSDDTLPGADGQRSTGAAWLLPDDPVAAWFTDSDAGAWLTETEAWLTDTEGELLPTDSDGAWLSDSDAVSSVFENLASSLPNWLSDEAEVETDGDVSTGTRTMVQDDVGSDPTASGGACVSLVEYEEGSVDVDGATGRDVAQGPATTHSDTRIGRPIESDFWESIGPLMGVGALNSAGTATGVAHDVQALLDSLVDL